MSSSELSEQTKFIIIALPMDKSKNIALNSQIVFPFEFSLRTQTAFLFQGILAFNISMISS